MNEQKQFDKPMIIDSPSLVSKTRRLTEWSLHILGWIVWMLFIRPLIILVLWYVAFKFFNYQMFHLEGINNPEYFGIGAGVLIIIYLVMFGWNRYNAWRFKGIDRRRSSGEANPENMSEYYKIRAQDIKALQESRNIDIHFLDNDIIELTSEKVSELKALYAPFNQAKHHDKSLKL